MATVKTVDITPTREGFAAIAAQFARQVVEDVKANRFDDDCALMREVIDIVFYLGQNSVSAGLSHDDALQVRSLIKARIPLPIERGIGR